MKWSIPIGRVLGIRLGIHITFFLIIAWIGWLGWSVGGWSASLWAVAMICLLFVCVILHELGHSIVALRFGIEVHSITLLPIGGVAGMKSMPEEPYQELLIAVAGPLVNVIILAILLPFRGFPVWLDMPIVPGSVPELVDRMIWANIILVVFNMIPAFPMDGGRVFRALLAMVFSYGTATAWAAGVGRVMAVLFVLVGLYLNPFLAFIGVFVFLGAEGEARMVRVKDALKNVPVSLLMKQDVPYVHRSDAVRTCLEAYHFRGCADFVVRDDNEGLLGLLPAEAWMDALKRCGPDEPVERHTERRFFALKPDTPLDAVIQDVVGMKQSIFPVMRDGALAGVLSLNDLRAFIAKRTGAGPVDRQAFSPAPPSDQSTEQPPSRLTVDFG